MSTTKFNSASPYISSALAIILGAAMVAWPGMVLDSIMTFLGWFLLFLGGVPIIYSLIKKLPVSFMSAVFLIAGIIILMFGGLFLSVIMWVFGIILIFAAINQFNVLSTARNNGYTIQSFSYISPVVLLVVGMITIFNPFAANMALVRFFGFGILFYGISMLVNQLTMKKVNIG